MLRRAMTGRVPLWVTLVPLLAGIGLYALLWRGWAADFEAEIERWLPADSFSVGGFPYRLEADAERPELAGGDVVKLRAAASAARINRGPWQPDLTVIRLMDPRVEAIVSPAVSARIEAKSATASINWGEGRLRRQSTIFQAARMRLGTSPLAMTADTLELHLRERADAKGQAAMPATSATRDVRGQLVLGGTRMRLAGGDALTMAGEVLATGAARLTDYDRWSSGGTLELTRLTLSDAHGEVLMAVATLAPQGRDGLRVAGTLTTVCPASVAAAFAGTSAPREKRLRVAVRLAFEGPFQAIRLAPLPDLTKRPRRDQQPNCPRLTS